MTQIKIIKAGKISKELSAYMINEPQKFMDSIANHEVVLPLKSAEEIEAVITVISELTSEVCPELIINEVTK